MHIKIDGNFYNILEGTLVPIPRNIYSQAKRVKNYTLKMIKVKLGTVYDIKVTIFGLNKETASQLQQSILKPEFDVEFYDTYSKSNKTLSFYAPDTELLIKRGYKDDVVYDDVPLTLTANEAADWVV